MHAEVAAEPGQRAREERGRSDGVLARIGLTLLVLAALWALWEGYRWLWMRTGWTRPFVVDDLTMPQQHKAVDFVNLAFQRRDKLKDSR